MSRRESNRESDDERFMRTALGLARKGIGRTSPNPAVGAVAVKNNRIIAKGFHRKAGEPHAEIEAIRAASEDVKGATLYVTLEPCCHFGRTPPCTDALIQSGIKEVVVGQTDPNPKVGGKGIERLRAAGIKVTSGILEDECRAINDPWTKYITRRIPFVALKLASSLDGRIAAGGGDSKWITGETSRRLVHRMRSSFDAVMVGINTVIKDDPELTVRLVKGKNPLRVILDSSLKIPLGARVFKDTAGLVIFTTRLASPAKIKKVSALGAKVIIVPRSDSGLDLKRVLKELGKMEVTSVLVEGGGLLAASLIKHGLADKFLFFISPMIIGGDGVPSIGPMGLKRLINAPRLTNIIVRRIGDDILIEGKAK
ncbi:MAG: bifunctional diaminohydroxyphosphoribosylaminopyrimidine deaminase/5-amino-6-(5-phosphoribosylamino)uracil reductase RibD [Deltaproteobacteria bacterium]|nr:bifunctional diaminohydroxyphosphoribosylaminopyrimidine deaminase/5-amino-6-(5-phosphoribosylamino)uracil reductase RibD [Deltaproteobacteria bacterium]